MSVYRYISWSKHVQTDASPARLAKVPAPRHHKCCVYPVYGCPSRTHPRLRLLAMNTFVNRFSSTRSTDELRKAQDELQEEGSSVALWGSNAGFGSLNKGIPTFNLPSLPDVCLIVFELDDILLT